ncbi:MAG: hypothetical protein ACRD68_07055 [Pyrinomonadaceae bacterium]
MNARAASRWVFAGVVSLFGFQCASTTSVPMTDSQAGGRAAVVRFPDPWVKRGPAGGETIMTQPHDYEIRKLSRQSADAGPGELIFAARAPDGSYSDNYYSVSLDGRAGVRAATAQEWGAAERVPNGRRQIQADANTHTPEGVRYGEKTFAKSGASWGTVVALVSPGGGSLAVFSYTSPEKPRAGETKDIFSSIGGGEPDRGEIFIDVYDTSSGAKVLAGRSPYAQLGPSILFSGALWVEDRSLVVPLDGLSQTSFLGILPAK